MTHRIEIKTESLAMKLFWTVAILTIGLALSLLDGIVSGLAAGAANLRECWGMLRATWERSK